MSDQSVQLAGNVSVAIASLEPSTATTTNAEAQQLEKVVAEEVTEITFSQDELKEMLEFANKALEGANNSLRFQFNDSVEIPIVTVVDQSSGQVIRQLPSEEIIRIAESIESMRGVLFDSTT